MFIIPQSPALVKWTDKKTQNVKLAARMAAAGFTERAYRMKMCGTLLDMQYCPDCQRSFVSSANLCRDRLCPTCSWRLSLKLFAEMCATLSYIKDIEDYAAGFLTLTIKNCSVNELRAAIGEMNSAWNRAMSGKRMKTLCAGFAKSLEITYNWQTKTFHPHFHIIMLTREGKTAGELHEFFRKKWAKVCRYDYEPITDYRGIKSDETRIDEEKFTAAILETYKYAVKSDEMEQMPLEIFREFVQQIGGLRFRSYGGIIKEARAEMCFTDDSNLDEPQREICDCGATLQKISLQWSFSDKQYKLMQEKLDFEDKH